MGGSRTGMGFSRGGGSPMGALGCGNSVGDGTGLSGTGGGGVTPEQIQFGIVVSRRIRASDTFAETMAPRWSN